MPVEEPPVDRPSIVDLPDARSMMMRPPDRRFVPCVSVTLPNRVISRRLRSYMATFPDAVSPALRTVTPPDASIRSISIPPAFRYATVMRAALSTNPACSTRTAPDSTTRSARSWTSIRPALKFTGALLLWLPKTCAGAGPASSRNPEARKAVPAERERKRFNFI